ncbi:TPA: hypothetical protein DEO28_02485 [Candidatus Dependentiae bacterium]|nr:MAG: hypothetical protein UR14_C0008G0013 [candidate division TM6 bacterium GW2011_GWE2_31_21]KKP53261.1 MAG: hypothetical protein UR43_C0006G0044 [candidate division TM6 bacterium GW2011_GWF2_33_332]HBS48040.1 hypothetical protein [Candidatus Dependentiae bacterium]HBZ73357.1 hypothetical protein [Candidatus Dependentiae bacterium]
MLKNSTKKAICFGLFGVSLLAASEPVKKIKKTNTTTIEKERAEDTSGAGLIEKGNLSIKNGDIELSFGGRTKIETYQTKNVVLLNKHVPDRFNYFKQTVDMSGDLTFGKEKYGYKAVEVFTNLRAKAVWGDSGKAFSTVEEPIKIDGLDTVVGEHSHRALVPFIGLREGWLQFSLNPLMKSEDERLQYLKLGLFPFSLGRGIALGDIYGPGGKEFLGISSGYNTDQFAPGINLYGDIVRNRLSYDLYYARLEENSDTLSKTFNHIKSNVIGRKATPYRGYGKDNELFAARFKWKAVDTGSFGVLNLEPYWMYNEGSDRWIETDGDGKSELGATGLGFEYAKGDFEFGMEGAFNFGRETVYAIDRNILELSTNSDGVVVRRYSKVLTSQGGSAAVATSAVQSSVSINTDYVDSAFNMASSDDLRALNNYQFAPGLWNATDRYRPSYKNKYVGWMFVADAAYTFKKQDLKAALAYGFASGDKNPHLPKNSTTERDKKYKGFIGIQEGYSGSRVPSVFVLDSRKLKRPMSIQPNDREAGDDGSFTDMQYFGTGLTWFPLEHDIKKCMIQTNVLGYFKNFKSHKYNATTDGYDPNHFASRFLGVELNFRVKYLMLKNLNFFTDFAIFLPGTYYKDMKGLPLRGDVFAKLDLKDKSGINSANYRLSNNTAYLLNAGIDYKF